MWVSPAQSVLTVTPVMVVVVDEPEPVKKAPESHFIAKTSSFFIAKTSKDAEYAKIDLIDGRAWSPYFCTISLFRIF